jgi:hypothetical protein
VGGKVSRGGDAMCAPTGDGARPRRSAHDGLADVVAQHPLPRPRAGTRLGVLLRAQQDAPQLQQDLLEQVVRQRAPAVVLVAVGLRRWQRRLGAAALAPAAERRLGRYLWHLRPAPHRLHLRGFRDGSPASAAPARRGARWAERAACWRRCLGDAAALRASGALARARGWLACGARSSPRAQGGCREAAVRVESTLLAFALRLGGRHSVRLPSCHAQNPQRARG